MRDTGLHPRYGRIAAVSSSLAVTVVAVLGGIGTLPRGGQPSYAAPPTGSVGQGRGLALSAQEGPVVEGTDRSITGELPPRPQDPAALVAPEDSGEGRRVVFDISDQRVWLVRKSGTVARSYLVSGSLTDNLAPGTYSVFSRSKDAVGVEDSGTMRFMVRFALGASAAIGFHDIPVLDGHKVQTRAELGTPQSHGCVRQWRPDAKAMWRFATYGTPVVVTA